MTSAAPGLWCFWEKEAADIAMKRIARNNHCNACAHELDWEALNEGIKCIHDPGKAKKRSLSLQENSLHLMIDSVYNASL